MHGWGSIAIAMLIINAIWVVFGALGYGLAGMRTRIEILHGEFSAGPRPEGGFRVSARVPVPLEA